MGPGNSYCLLVGKLITINTRGWPLRFVAFFSTLLKRYLVIKNWKHVSLKGIFLIVFFPKAQKFKKILVLLFDAHPSLAFLPIEVKSNNLQRAFGKKTQNLHKT